MADADEHSLIEAARGGDTEAFGVLVERYMPRAVAFARHMTGRADDASDLAQDAFVKAWRGIGSFKGESGFYTWFFRVLANICVDHLRKEAFRKKLFFFARDRDDGGDETADPVETAPDEDPGSVPDVSLGRKELRAALGKAVRGLPARQRAVFLMKHVEGMKITEIAVALGISEGAVKSHLVRSVTALRKGLKGYAPGS
ncbi:MAG: sigma-70 family RNA polymerase sigma factor [Nitrospirae bacterium]|nr:sigma-70 family RNA polymerase sigma factor [Nitrospirota bacterium]MBI5695437.1 sigma-70 family RNA polymerase sigma factor [Nitrospirota bacterium]